MKKIKRALAILLVMIVSFSVVSVGAEAVSVSTTDGNYGYMIPTNYNFTKSLSTVYLYGNYDYINFYINSKSNGRYFFFEIYSDPAYTKPVYSDYTYCDQIGTYTYTPYIKLLGTFSSGTYYCLTYSAYVDENNDYIAVSKPSLASFKLVVNRLPKYNQQVVGLRSVTNTADGPKVSWYKLNDSTVKYNIYRRQINGTQWVKVGTVNGSTYTFTDKTVKNTTGVYIYTVRGQDKNGTLTRYLYKGISVKYTQAPVITSVQVNADNIVKVKWTHPRGDKSNNTIYSVYRKENNGNWVRVFIDDLFPGEEKVFYDKTAKSGNHYQYTVRVNVWIDNYGYAFSSYNEGKSIDYIAAPKLNQPQFNDEGMTVSWNAAEGAEKYAIYRKPLEPNSTWKILGRVDGSETSYIDKTAVEDGAYRYTVRSEGATNQGSYYSNGVCYVNLTEPEVKVVNITNKYLYLKWDKVEYADRYYFMYDDGNGWCSKNGAIRDCYHNFYYSQYNCQEYKFSVMPAVGEHKGTYRTDVKSVVTFPTNNINRVVYKDYIRLSWKNIKADSYNVYRKLTGAPDSEYELLANITNTAYNDYSAEENVTYTYCVRAVYHSVEQNMNIPYATITKYSADKYIKSFKVNKIVSYDNETNKTLYDYEFEVEKTPEGKNLKTVVYALGVNGWVNVTGQYFNFDNFEFATAEPVFYAVAYDSNGRTHIDGCPGVPVEEMCEAPKIKLNVLKNTVNVSWNAVDGAVAYRVVETNNGIERVVDGSTLSIKINSSDLSDNLRLRVSAVHSNGNVTETRLNKVSYTTSIPAVLKVTSGENGNTVYLTGPMYYENSVYHIFRKAPGQKNWTRVGYYQGKPFVDTTAQAGVKYTYTVRLYDYVNKFYMSYYDTVGVQVGQIQTPRLNGATDYGNYILVSWNYQYNEECFYVYRRTANSGWVKIATVNSYEANWYLDTTAKSGETYYYTVRAYDGKVVSGYDPVGVKCTKS